MWEAFILVWGLNQCAIISSWYHFLFICNFDFHPSLKIYNQECGGNSMMMDITAHSQHMNDVK